MVCKTTYAKKKRMFAEVAIKVSINEIAAQCFVPFVCPIMQIGNPRIPRVASATVAKGRLPRRLCAQKGLHATDVNAIATQMSALIAQRAAVAQEIGSTLRC